MYNNLIQYNTIQSIYLTIIMMIIIKNNNKNNTMFNIPMIGKDKSFGLNYVSYRMFKT